MVFEIEKQQTRKRQFGAYHALMSEMEGKDPDSYVSFVRMHTQHFQQLLAAVTPLILKEEDLMRGIIRPDEIYAIIC